MPSYGVVPDGLIGENIVGVLTGYLTAQADSRPVWNANDFFGTKFAAKAVGR